MILFISVILSFVFFIDFGSILIVVRLVIVLVVIFKQRILFVVNLDTIDAQGESLSKSQRNRPFPKVSSLKYDWPWNCDPTANQ